MTDRLGRGHAILALFVLAAAIGAYIAAHPPAGSAERGTVLIWDVPVHTIAALHFRDKGARTVLRPRWEGRDAAYVWIETVAAKPEPGAQAGEEASAPAPDSTPDAFKGNSAAVETLRAFAALPAQRDLGRLDALDAARYGLEAGEGDGASSLELRFSAGEPLRLRLGRETYGHAGRYAHNPGDGRVYLLRLSELRRLASVRGSLMDRDLLGIRADSLARIQVTLDGVTATFHHLAEPGQWADAPDASQGDPELTDMAAALDRLKVVRYLDEDDSRAAGAPALELSVFEGEETEPKAWLRLYGVHGKHGVATSSYTRRPVEVSVPLLQQLLLKARAAVPRT